MPSDRIDLLRRVPLFADLERRELAELASSLKERRFRAGETIAQEGEGAIGFFIVEEGSARVSVRGEERGRLGAGDYFGEIALIAHSARTATVIADTDLRCLAMTFWDFRPFVENNGGVAWKMLEALSKRVRDLEQRT